jgi:methionyl-tRNA synthetase
MSRPFYITTPIYYPNGKPHIGHAYTTIIADASVRWRKLHGEETKFLTGMDEHGQKVQRAAEKAGITPLAWCDKVAESFQTLWKKLHVEPDNFYRTTSPTHARVVRTCLQNLYDKGEIYQADYSGWYSVTAERFWTQDELLDGKCPDSGGPVEWVTEHAYFFRMSAYQDRLIAVLKENPQLVQPDWRRNEVLGFLSKPINDLCISRPKSRLSWGIPLPFDEDYVAYVWFDALTNYIAEVGLHQDEEKFAHWWPGIQLCGKDILTFHTVYWFSMLLAQGLPLPVQVQSHGWWLVKGEKMSKSLGNVVDPDLLADSFGPDALRYFLLREIPFGNDGEYDSHAFLTRYNADLVNDFGNLAHRSLPMIANWLDGKLGPAGPREGTDQALWDLAESATKKFDTLFRAFQFRDALDALWELIKAGNKYLDTEGPWTLNKEGKKERLGTVLRNAMEVCRIAASHLWPVCPQKSIEMLERVGESGPILSPRLDQLPGDRIFAPGPPLFPRLLELPPKIAAILEQARPSLEPAPKPQPPKKDAPVSTETPPSDITYEDFAKLQLRTGKILAAERHPNADRLLVLKVDIGEPEPRTIVAGIAAVYKPEELLGQQIVVVANLKPAKLRGVMSQGMLLAAGGPEVAALVRPQVELPPGTVVK